LKNKSFEEIINMWSQELEDQTINFRKQALEIFKWDRVLVENSDRIMSLQGNVTQVENSQKKLSDSLDTISRQQEELHQLLTSLELEVDKIYAQRDGEMTPVDYERESGYALADNINGELDQMSNTLKEIVTKLNASHKKAADSDNPVYQVVEILNAHLHSLQWLNENSNQVQTKLGRLSHEFQIQKVQQDQLRKLRSASYYT